MVFAGLVCKWEVGWFVLVKMAVFFVFAVVFFEINTR